MKLPDWYHPQNFSDAALVRTISDVGDFEVTFEYDPGDRSVGIRPGWAGVTFSVTTGLIDCHLYFAWESDNLGAWPLDSVSVGVALGDGKVKNVADIDTRAKLADFPTLLKLAEEKWAAIAEVERQEVAAENAKWEQWQAQEREAHQRGEHNDGYDHPECPVCV